MKVKKSYLTFLTERMKPALDALQGHLTVVWIRPSCQRRHVVPQW